MTTIKLKNGSGAPAGGDLVQGEPALDLTNKRLYTEDSGGNVIEVGTNPGVDVTFADNRKAIFGAGSDLQIYHDGSNSYLKDAGTGDLYIQGEANVRITDGDGNKMFLGQNDGEVQLYYNGAEKLNTTNTGIDVTGTVTVSDGSTSAPSITNAGDSNSGIYFPADDNIGLVVGGSRKLLANSSGVSINNGVLDADGGITVDNITIDGNEIDVSSGDLTLDVAGNIILDVDGGEVKFDDGGTRFANLYKSSNNFVVSSAISDGDILFKGNDGGSTITALTLDMSDFGGAIFNSHVTVSTDLYVGQSIIHNGDADTSIDFDTNLMKFRTAGTERMRISSAGNVGIGISPNASADLHVADTSDARIWLEATSGDTMELYAGTNVSLFNRSNNALTFGTNNTERMRIDSSGNVGIGQAPTAFANWRVLELKGGTAGAMLNFENSASTRVSTVAYDDGNDALRIQNFLANPITFETNNTERMRIDSNGQLLLGTTENVFGGADRYGFNFYANGQSNQSIDGTSGAVAQYINRENADGAFTEFYKDRAKVGSIGAFGGDLHIGTNDSGLRFEYAGLNAIVPFDVNSLAISDAATDLGHENARFKDLHLSGSVELGDGGNISWGGTYGGGNPTIAASSNFIAFYPEGNVSAEAARIDASSNLLVGASSFSFAGSNDCVQVSGTEGRINIENDTTSTANVIAFYSPNGNVGRINTAGTSTNYLTSSDQRLKENIVDAPSASDDIDAIQVRSFDWKVDGSHQKYGMVAQELQSVAPEAVSEGATEEEMMGVDYSKLVPMLVKEIQSLRARVAQLETN